MNSNFKYKVLFIFIVIFIFTPILAQSEASKINIVKSLIVPGWGELSLGNKSGYIFIASEAFLWLSNLYYHSESDLKLEESYQYALKYAHINPGNYGTDYYRDLSKYMSYGFETGGHNQEIVSEAQDLFPDNPAAQQDYIQDNIYTEEYYWNWDNKNHRGKYREIRNKSLDYSEIAKSLGGAILANHLLSGLNAFRIIKKRNKLDLSMSLNNKMKPNFNIFYYF